MYEDSKPTTHSCCPETRGCNDPRNGRVVDPRPLNYVFLRRATEAELVDELEQRFGWIVDTKKTVQIISARPGPARDA